MQITSPVLGDSLLRFQSENVVVIY